MGGIERIVVAGAGAAGFRAAERLRELGFTGDITMVGDEQHRPYHRPTVSKHLLRGTVKSRDVTLRASNDLDLRWRLGAHAWRLQPDRRLLHLPGGEELRYDGLILATGVHPRSLPDAPRHDPRIRVLRTIEDALAVRATMRSSTLPAVVVGAGFIGCEFAATMRAMGRDVVVVNNASKLLHRFGDTIAGAANDLHAEHGVQVRTRAGIQRWVPGQDGIGLHFDRGKPVLAGCVVLAVGSTPSVQWLRGSGLDIADGVRADAGLFACGAEDVVVAGDIARWPNLRFDAVPRRVEHWLTAVESGRAAAANLLRGKANATPFTPLPRAWTSQYSVRVQHVGMPALATDTVRLDAGVTGFVRAGRLVGVATWDRPHAMVHWAAELDRSLPAPNTSPSAAPAVLRTRRSPDPTLTQPIARVVLPRHRYDAHGS